MRRFTKVTALIAAAVGVMLVAFAGTASAQDRNNDRIPDRWERNHGLSLQVKQTFRDQDSDGLVNLGEFRSETDPLDEDSDNDGTEDADEDLDRDDVDNGNEVDEGTDPDDVDTDDDGRLDDREDADHDGLNNEAEDESGNEPDDPDTDDDGDEDGDELAGIVASFDGVNLAISTFGAPDVVGTVDSDTEIECETEDEHEVSDESGDDGDEGLDDEGDDLDIDEDRDDADSNDLDDSDESGDEDNVCTTADLVAGVAVHEAELEGGVFTEIELIK